MKYSKTAHAAGASGFFFDNDPNVPADAVKVSDSDVQTAINLPSGSTYDFDTAGTLTTAGPSSAQQLANAQSAQIDIIEKAYRAAIYADIAFTTAAGVTQTFQADSGSQGILTKSKARYMETGTTPASFFWQAKDNTQVPFTFADLQGLYNAMFDRGQLAFAKKASLKAQIRAATDVASVQAVVW